MPIYEYLCEQHSITELVASIGDAPATIKCPICDEHIPRVYSVPGIQFKGSGFYKTDNR